MCAKGKTPARICEFGIPLSTPFLVENSFIKQQVTVSIVALKGEKGSLFDPGQPEVYTTHISVLETGGYHVHITSNVRI